jgi:hypothetical protein
MAIYVRCSDDAYFWFCSGGTRSPEENLHALWLAHHHPEQLDIPTPPIPEGWRKRDGTLKKEHQRAWARYQRQYRQDWIAELRMIAWVATVDVGAGRSPG